MIKPIVSLQEWCQRYNLHPAIATCTKCGKKFETTVPFAIEGYRGLIAEPHDCGENYSPFIIIPVSEQEIQFWCEHI